MFIVDAIRAAFPSPDIHCDEVSSVRAHGGLADGHAHVAHPRHWATGPWYMPLLEFRRWGRVARFRIGSDHRDGAHSIVPVDYCTAIWRCNAPVEDPSNGERMPCGWEIETLGVPVKARGSRARSNPFSCPTMKQAEAAGPGGVASASSAAPAVVAAGGGHTRTADAHHATGGLPRPPSHFSSSADGSDLAMQRRPSIRRRSSMSNLSRSQSRRGSFRGGDGVDDAPTGLSHSYQAAALPPHSTDEPFGMSLAEGEDSRGLGSTHPQPSALSLIGRRGSSRFGVVVERDNDASSSSSRPPPPGGTSRPGTPSKSGHGSDADDHSSPDASAPPPHEPAIVRRQRRASLIVQRRPSIAAFETHNFLSASTNVSRQPSDDDDDDDDDATSDEDEDVAPVTSVDDIAFHPSGGTHHGGARRHQHTEKKKHKPAAKRRKARQTFSVSVLRAYDRGLEIERGHFVDLTPLQELAPGALHASAVPRSHISTCIADHFESAHGIHSQATGGKMTTSLFGVCSHPKACCSCLFGYCLLPGKCCASCCGDPEVDAHVGYGFASALEAVSPPLDRSPMGPQVSTFELPRHRSQCHGKMCGTVMLLPLLPCMIGAAVIAGLVTVASCAGAPCGRDVPPALCADCYYRRRAMLHALRAEDDESPCTSRAIAVCCCPCSEVQLWREIYNSGVWPGLLCWRAADEDVLHMSAANVRQRYSIYDTTRSTASIAVVPDVDDGGGGGDGEPSSLSFPVVVGVSVAPRPTADDDGHDTTDTRHGMPPVAHSRQVLHALRTAEPPAIAVRMV